MTSERTPASPGGFVTDGALELSRAEIWAAPVYFLLYHFGFWVMERWRRLRRTVERTRARYERHMRKSYLVQLTSLSTRSSQLFRGQARRPVILSMARLGA